MKQTKSIEIFETFGELFDFISENPLKKSFDELVKIVEFNNSKRLENSAYFTDYHLLEEIYEILPDFEKESITIVEPSVGAGSFIPLIVNKYKTKNVRLVLVDIDEQMILLLKAMLKFINIPDNFDIEFVCSDYLLLDLPEVDLIIGNPPYKNDSKHEYKKFRMNPKSYNLFNYFIEKSFGNCEKIIFVIPKYILGANKYEITRNMLYDSGSVSAIVDFGEKGFKGVKIETICLYIDKSNNSRTTRIKSLIVDINEYRNQDYIFDSSLPTWIIYRNKMFDEVMNSMKLGEFTVYRDRQILNKHLNSNTSGIRVLRSRNIGNNSVIDIENYDRYIDENTLSNFDIGKYKNKMNCLLVPNMTYYPRAVFKPDNCVVNGSVAVLETEQKVNTHDLEFFASEEFREYYKVARNYATRTLNIDNTHVYYFGIRSLKREGV